MASTSQGDQQRNMEIIQIISINRRNYVKTKNPWQKI